MLRDLLAREKVSEMRFRQARGTDAAPVASLYLASRKVHLPFAPLTHSDEEVREWIRLVLIPSGRVAVAVDGQRIAGMIATSVDVAGCGWIDHLYLAPDCVARGIGSELLSNALRDLPRPVRLHTFEQNAGARRFYERHGFIPIAFTDGSQNEERCPDVLYELR